MKEKMRYFKILFFILLFFSLVVSISGCSSIGIGGSGKANYSISGTVTEAYLGGLAGVTINLTGSATTSTTTDASGNFTFTSPAFGSYTLTPIKEGFTFTPTRQVKVANGANISGVNFMATDSAYIYIPNTVFHEGPPPTASGSSTVPVVTSATPSGSLYLNSWVTWTVTWVVTPITVTYLDVYIPEMGGYFEYEVAPEEASAGKAQLDMVESFTLPSTESCTPPCPTCWCAVKAPEATTESLETRFSLVADEGSVGVTYLGGVGLHIAGYGLAFFGCMDPNATNYDPSASQDNGKCTYKDVVPSPDSGLACPIQPTGCCEVQNTDPPSEIISFPWPKRCGCPEGTISGGDSDLVWPGGPWEDCFCQCN